MPRKFDKLFQEKNITTYYNSLGMNDELLKTYARFTRQILLKNKISKSHFVKFDCYKELYPTLKKRKKATGFEKFVDLDFKLRINWKKNIGNQELYGDNFSIPHSDTNLSTKEDYENLLIKEIKKEDKSKLLYLSGGLDSELLAYLFLKNNIEFTPIIFQWTNDQNEICNIGEVSNAFDFCKNYNLTPTVELFNVHNFWNSTEITDLAKDTRIMSPHVLTHYKAVDIINKKFLDYAHYFGGECRYTIERDENLQNFDFISAGKLAKFTTVTWDPDAGWSVGGGVASKPLYYGWTTANTLLVGGGGSGGPGTSTSAAGGGGGGGQARTITYTKDSGTSVGTVNFYNGQPSTDTAIQLTLFPSGFNWAYHGAMYGWLGGAGDRPREGGVSRAASTETNPSSYLSSPEYYNTGGWYFAAPQAGGGGGTGSSGTSGGGFGNETNGGAGGPGVSVTIDGVSYFQTGGGGGGGGTNGGPGSNGGGNGGSTGVNGSPGSSFPGAGGGGGGPGTTAGGAGYKGFAAFRYF